MRTLNICNLRNLKITIIFDHTSYKACLDPISAALDLTSSPSIWFSRYVKPWKDPRKTCRHTQFFCRTWLWKLSEHQFITWHQELQNWFPCSRALLGTGDIGGFSFLYNRALSFAYLKDEFKELIAYIAQP